MSLSAIPNQPVVFDDTVGLIPISTWDYAQLINTTDVTHFQMQNDICVDSNNKVEDNDFSDPQTYWTFGAGWAFQGRGDAKASKVSGNLSDLSQSGVFVIGRRYEVQIDIKALNLAEGSAGFKITDGVQTIGFITSEGLTKLWFTAQGNDILITPSDINDTVSIRTVSAYSMTSDVIISIWSEGGVYVDSINTTDNPSAFEFVKDKVNIQFDWFDFKNDLTAGNCYYLCVHDGCDNTNGQVWLPNGDFLDKDFDGNIRLWTESNNSNVNVVVYELNPNSTHLILMSTGAGTVDFQHDTIEFGQFSYDVTIDVVDPGAGNWSVNVNVGDGNLNQALLSAGTITVSVTNSSTVDTDLKLEFSSAGSDTIKIGSISVELTDKSNLVCDHQTNKFNYGTHDNSIQLNANNHQDAYGFVWDEGKFNPTLRFGGRLVPNETPFTIEREVEMDSLGNKSAYFHHRREHLTLAFHNEPYPIHKFLSLLLGIEHWFLNGVEYFVEDDAYDIDWNASHTLGKVQLQVSEKTQDIEKVNTKDDTGGLKIDDNFRITTDDNFRITTDGTQRIIN